MTQDRILTDEQLGFFKDNGYLIVKGVFDSSRVAELDEAMEKLVGGEDKKKLRSAFDLKRPDKTVLVLLNSDDGWIFFDENWRSLEAVAQLVKKNGAQVFYNLKSAAVAMRRQAKR